MLLAERIKRFLKRDKIAWNEARALMQQLIERVLAVGPRFAPIDRPGLVIDRLAEQRNVLAVALHRKLLQIGWKALEVLLVRQHCHGFSTEKVVVPDAEQPHHD